jgi:hypothetical protein
MTSAHQVLVRQPTFHLFGEQFHPRRVRHLAGRTPKVVLSDVAVKVLDTDMVVGAIDGPLQLTKERLHAVGRIPVEDVLASGVVHDHVFREERGEPGRSP